MANRNPQNPNPDRSPSGNDPNRRKDNANQGTEGGRSSSNKPGHPSRPEKGEREGVPGTEQRYDAERDRTPGGRGEAPEVGLDEDIDRPEVGTPGERGRTGGRGDMGSDLNREEGGRPSTGREQNDAGDRVRREPDPDDESGRS